jgi:enoyl-[acyl-carrier protein] reductase/trans-2-enoyl-CoA reductase (NAD+)
MDDWEMKPEVQQAVLDVWNTISQDNLEQVTDIAGYWQEFYEIFGFGIEGVDYDADVETEVAIPSLT